MLHNGNVKYCSCCKCWKKVKVFYICKGSLLHRCRTCRKKAQRDYYAKNKEFYKDYAKLWSDQHALYRKEYSKKYREKNKDKIMEYNQNYYKNVLKARRKVKKYG